MMTPIFLVGVVDFPPDQAISIVATIVGGVTAVGIAVFQWLIRRSSKERLDSASKFSRQVRRVVTENSEASNGRQPIQTDNPRENGGWEPASANGHASGWQPITAPDHHDSAEFVKEIGRAAAYTSAQQADLYLEHHKTALKLHTQYQLASLYAGLFGFLLILFGGVLSYIASLDIGILTAVAGAISTGAGGLLFKRSERVESRAIDLLEKSYRSVDRGESLRQTLNVAAMISDEATRNRVYSVVALQTAFSSSTPDALYRISMGEEDQFTAMPAAPIAERKDADGEGERGAEAGDAGRATGTPTEHGPLGPRAVS
jgi:hypothetical protein